MRWKGCGYARLLQSSRDLPGGILGWFSMFTATKTSMGLKLHQNLIGEDHVNKASLCLVGVLLEPLKLRGLVSISDHLAIRTSAEGPTERESTA